MNEEWEKDFTREPSKVTEGAFFYFARDHKYRGFMTFVQPNESLYRVYTQFQTFKDVVDGRIKAEVIQDEDA